MNSGRFLSRTTTEKTTRIEANLSLDFFSILKASQIISGEIILDKLLTSLMKVLVENAGAEKGFLLLEQKEKQEKDKENINNPNDKDKQEAQPQMSKEQAEKMLNALKNDEKKMQSLRKKKGDPGQKVKVEKDW